MAHRVAKSNAKHFLTKGPELQELVIRTMRRISDAVSSSMGPGGRPCLIESDLPNIPPKATKDGVSIFRSLGAQNSYEHLIIETALSSSLRTCNEAGDGTTTTCLLAYELIKNIFNFCDNNPKESPQKTVRRIKKVMNELIIPYIKQRSIKVTEDNQELLLNVATVSANGDLELARAVIQCFEEVGYGESSHVTIREQSGPSGFSVAKIEGLPFPIGLEESSGKYFSSFINDQGNQRCFLENPKFILYDGVLPDLISVGPLFNAIEARVQENPASAKELKSIVLVANGFSENVLSTLAFNFEQTGTLRIVPIKAPMAQFMNAQTHWLTDLAAFTGAKVFGMKNQISEATIADLGTGMESFESTRFRSTLSGNPDPVNIEVRSDELRKQLKRAESMAEAGWLEERIAKITSGIAKLTIIGSNPALIKEIADRAEDSVCSIRSSITHGVLPGGGRVALDLVTKIENTLEKGDPAREVLIPSLLAILEKLLDNAGYHEEDSKGVINRLKTNQDEVYDLENQAFGSAEQLGLFDASKAVSESIINAVEMASILGTLGGIVCHPRDAEFERREASLDSEWEKVSKNPDAYQNPVLNRVRN